jgi:hypothetical protein
MTSYHLRVTSIFLLASLTTACSVDAAPVPLVATNMAPPPAELEAPSAEPEAPAPEIGPPVSSTPTISTPDPKGFARTALAAWLGVPEESVQVILVESVAWPDASLGCPQPGQAYAQVVTPGFRFTFEVAGRSYLVHTGLSHLAVVCSEDGVPSAPLLPIVPGEIDDGEPWMPVN